MVRLSATPIGRSAPRSRYASNRRFALAVAPGLPYQNASQGSRHLHGSGRGSFPANLIQTPPGYSGAANLGAAPRYGNPRWGWVDSGVRAVLELVR